MNEAQSLKMSLYLEKNIKSNDCLYLGTEMYWQVYWVIDVNNYGLSYPPKKIDVYMFD